MFSSIRAWISVWVNNGKVIDLRRHRAHFDVIVMVRRVCLCINQWPSGGVFVISTFKLILKRGILSLSCAIALSWIPPSIKYHSISSQSFKLIITLLTLGQHDGLMTIVGAYVVFHKAGVIIRSNGLLWSSVRKESCNMLLHILYGRRFNDYYAGCSSVYIAELLHQLIHISNKDNTLQHFILFSN